MERDFSANQKNEVIRTHYDEDSVLQERVGTGNMFSDSGDKSGAELMVYKDKDGLPVTYDAAIKNKKMLG